MKRAILSKLKVLLCAGMVAVTLCTFQATAGADTVYVFSSSGSPVLLSGATYQDPVVFSATGSVVGYVDASGWLHDPVTDAIIGLVVHGE